ncbi:arsenate reductase (glutaredoxin) [Flavicella sediminum]|uniref:arsenate reductase (glutaredoxin) n=1 Tax=Flavicella sediminum TaxID=2585141 RepID=UPI00112215B8|nr:arsenate reductase (glutaredoxin) [Flavicella sediminum]
MMKIYHNPRCTKSRQGVAFLEEAKVDFEIIKYLETPLKKEELKDILVKLNYTPIQLVRKTEAIWKENFKGKELSDEEIIEAMVSNPKLIERPIILKDNKAVVARPTEKISELL